ncbi:MAG: damage-inducible protein DinB [Flavobacteriaceae bacterium]|nr:damage-inducible protein DinB [Flavobacteriaceae bacterium]|tara:strand:+ start:9365 stop:9883 length:519 start_codon:yes stop_codon:yes gene_type:complete
MRKSSISKGEYGDFYQRYIHLAGDGSIHSELKNSGERIYKLFAALSSEEWERRYAPEKWSLKEMLCHIIDTERVFSFRAFWVSRSSEIALPGFDQDAFLLQSGVEHRTTDSLLSEYHDVRSQTRKLFESFSEEQLLRTGEASGAPLSVRAAGYIICGHEQWHLQIVKDRYLH